MIFMPKLFAFNLKAQQYYSTEKDTLKSYYYSWFISADFEKTINSEINYNSVGFSASFLIRNIGFIGFYASGMVSSFKYVDFNHAVYSFSDYNLNFSHGGLYLGIKPKIYNRINTLFSLKIGRGAFFLYENGNTYNYSFGRDNVWVFTPMFETQIRMLSWVKLNLSTGVRFIEGISSHFHYNEQKIKLYQNSYFDGFVIGLSIRFCKN